ncbi:hypothetical protein SAMD00023353_1900180 [Rosellinia necatrix]|uniref:Uncharacterized protein n=1 Tax=Rosellinia necatrix TaxID=77044 RepID=A0A1S8A7F5_ROSNE|nr:hypothetical protein SAMD00023353_1900180 [Rosellinia necatrix]
MTASTRTGVPLDVATRQMSIASFHPRSASEIEILGIATATCLLAFFLCLMICMGLWMSWDAQFPGSNAPDLLHTTETFAERGRAFRSIRRWTGIPPSRSRTGYDGQIDGPRIPYFVGSAPATRMKTLKKSCGITNRYYHTRIPAKCKLLPRRPLLSAHVMIDSIRQKGPMLDMEEGLGLIPNTTTTVDNSPNCTRSTTVASSADRPDAPFLHSRTASL